MTDSETVHDTKEEYRDHYIRVTVTATPPLPHDDEAGTVTARVRLYDGLPADMTIMHFSDRVAGDVVDSWADEIPLYDSEDAIESLVEAAKDRVDTRVGQAYGLTESATIAVERQLASESAETGN
ncbi:hypothetical protein SAMN05216388_1017108 [Halorientalis persicus]|uniref:Uncharacterized protein n=1 Tax=Halorientalis persicus TaxID=1367881 RepID=A0A1H8S1S0_9EURY|nr:hypothetical protein [Halorientalis persicus]SEO72288.1 hypothetical protein SAMN05216388_1017108 [Halorientalis persicus]